MRAHGLAEHIRVETGDFHRGRWLPRRCPAPRRKRPPTAILAVDDMTCLGPKSAATELGIDVTRPAARALAHQRRRRQLRHRRRAAETLLARIHDPDREAELHLMAPVLYVRGTSTPPSG